MHRIISLAFAALVVLAGTCARASEALITEGIVTAAPSAVWSAWTTTEGLRSWLAPHADIDLRVDGLMRANYNPKGSLGDTSTIENRILSFDPGRMLSIRVAKAPDGFPFKAKVGEMWTVLYFQPTADGNTLLRIVGLGFGADEESQKMLMFFSQGNAYTLLQLQKRFQQ